jgi:hypothetical protein
MVEDNGQIIPPTALCRHAQRRRILAISQADIRETDNFAERHAGRRYDSPLIRER